MNNEDKESVCPAYSFINGDSFYPEELNDEYDLKIIAYETNPEMKFHNPSGQREWIKKTGPTVHPNGEVEYSGYGKRCLPLVAANTLGWQVLSDQRYEVEWNGGHSLTDITVTCDNNSTNKPFLSSHFGPPTVTWHIGHILFTTKGNFMYCKGPTNHFKHGIQPIEGLIETDWLPFTFTMNWMFTEPGKVVWEKGEPICQLFPYPKEYAENFDPVIRHSTSMPSELKKLYEYWVHSRDVFNSADNRDTKDWEGNYFRGEVHDETTCEELGRKHYTTIKMPKWKVEDSGAPHTSD